MTTAHLVSFVLVLAAAAAIPGPDVAALIARSLSSGMRRTLPLLLGIVAGHAIWLLAAVTGLAFLAQTIGSAFILVKIAAVGYLFYLAWNLWYAPVGLSIAEAAPKRDDRMALLSGLLISFSNPKALVFFSAIVPSIIPVSALGLADITLLVAVSSLTLIAVLGGWTAIGAKAGLLLKSTSRRRLLNRLSALIMAGTGIAVAAR